MEQLRELAKDFLKRHKIPVWGYQIEQIADTAKIWIAKYLECSTKKSNVICDYCITNGLSEQIKQKTCVACLGGGFSKFKGKPVIHV